MTTSEAKEDAARTEQQDRQEERLEIPDTLPVLPLSDMVTFPFMIVPLLVSNEGAISAVDIALSRNRMILLVTQRQSDVENPTPKDLYDIGTVGVVIRMLKMPDQKVRVLAQGVTRAHVRKWETGQAFIQANIEVVEEAKTEAPSLELEALRRNVNAALEKATSLGRNIPQEVMVIASNLDDPGRLADLAASNLSLKVEEAQEILSILDPWKRLRRIHELLTREIELLTVQQRISSQAKDEMDKGQREYFLRQQLKAIQGELGEGNELQEEVRRYAARAEEAKMPKEAREEFDRQLRRLERLHPDAAETSIVRTHLDWMAGLPWSSQTNDSLNLRKAEKVLDEDHYGLEKIKERILEHLAVRKLKKDGKGPILCFVGPPGTGKTSLGKSIARALGRRFVRLSLGGVHDEAEIRGHRRTYVGAMPGRIIQEIHQAGSNNPVFMMDEVDKIGADFRGDPSSALLEVLDPEQNSTFRDNYLGVSFDLSRVLFITTANILDTIQPAFLDRMEVLRLSGYTEQEKLQIARRHLLSRQLEAHGLKGHDLRLSSPALRAVIRGYTREAGLRNLEREMASICRKVAVRHATGRTHPVAITQKNLARFLGAPSNMPGERLLRSQVGIATGLAWTPVGGEVMFVEAQAMAGKGNFILTGQMGNVMKESAQAALSFARARASEYGVSEDFFTSHDFHIHIPEGAIPKDGPSAGITLAVSLVSACTGRRVRRDIALTGEITLRGDVLPIGGVKEKVLAAHRGRIRTIMLPRQNEKDLEEIPRELRRDLKLILVDRMTEVLRHALI
jgi:ATP-dependent Lon protease